MRRGGGPRWPRRCRTGAARGCAAHGARATPTRRSNIVALNGGSFIARRDEPGECPGNGWQSLTLPGKRGAAGEAGKKGERGEKGERGPGIIGWEVDQYAVRAVLANKSRSEPLDLRNLFEQFILERVSDG